MTILAKLTGEKKDLEKVPLPLHLNDEAMMHHGSLMSVSSTCNSRLYNQQNLSLRAPIYPVSFALSLRYKFRFHLLCVCVWDSLSVGEPLLLRDFYIHTNTCRTAYMCVSLCAQQHAYSSIFPC